MPNLVYEGTVSSWDKKADGSPLIIGKGDRKGEPYYKLSFKVDGEYVNLMDFDGVTGGQKGDYRVEYYQKFQPNGEPDLYNGKPQYNLVALTPLGAQGGANPASPAASGPQTHQGTQVAHSADTQVEIRREVAAKCASELLARRDPLDMAEWSFTFQHILAELAGESIEQAAARKLDATPAPEPTEEDPDEDIPFDHDVGMQQNMSDAEMRAGGGH